MPRTFLWPLAAVLGGLATAAPAPAQIITPFRDRASFNAATTDQNTFDFSGLAALNGSAFFPSPPGLTLNGVNFQSSTNRLFVIGREFQGGAFAFTGADFVLQNNAIATLSDLTITLPAGTTAFGFDIGLQANGPGPIDIVLSTGEIAFLLAPNRPGLTFVGVVSDVPISSARLTFFGFGQPFGPSLANFTTAQAAAVPEPGSLALLATAAAGLGGWAWRRRRRA